jgi:galactitol-specific phosphotransferase system IIB component
MKIGIERSLKNIKEYLEQNNIQAVMMDDPNNDNKGTLKKYDAIVISGQDTNFLGMQDTTTKTQVINAEGKTAEEVYREINSRLR